MKVKVKQLALNQFEIHTDEGDYFQSYDSIIVFCPRNSARVYLDKKYWDYSNTTRKWRNKFLNTTSKVIKEEINSGSYELINLN